MLGAFVLVTALIQSRFVDGANIRFILTQTSLYALVAVGEAMVILTRNVDLSVGSVVGLSAYVSANQFGAHPGIPIPVVFLVGLGVGIVCGVANGAITAVGRVPSLVVTLAMLYIIRGVDTIIVGSGEVVASTEPNSFLNLPQATVAGIPDMALAVVVGRRDRRLLPQLVPLGPRPLRDRLGPAGGAPGRASRSPGGCSSRSSSAAASPASLASSGRASTRRSTRPPPTASSCRSSPPSSSAASRSSAAAAASSAPRSGRCCCRRSPPR